MAAATQEGWTRVPIGFPGELYEWLREAAFRRRVPMAAVVREALEEYRGRLDPQLNLPIRKAHPPEKG